MRIFDFIIQTMILFVALFCLALGKEGLVWVAFIQFGMGCWQLVSAIISTVKKKTPVARTMMILYWSFVAGYFLMLAGLYFADMKDLALIWFFFAWIIAIYYYVFTIRMAFLKENEKKSFLDVVN